MFDNAEDTLYGDLRYKCCSCSGVSFKSVITAEPESMTNFEGSSAKIPWVTVNYEKCSNVASALDTHLSCENLCGKKQ
jgi:hypothetical protein